MRTVVVIHPGLKGARLRQPEVFSAEEIDRLDEGMLSGMDRRQLIALLQKLSDSFDWLVAGDWDPDDPRWEEWDKRLDRLDNMMDIIDGILDAND